MGICDSASCRCRHHQLLVGQHPVDTANGAVQLTVYCRAKMFGQFDPKWLYIICVAMFEVGSALCGAAPSMDALIVGRAIAGLGGAGMYLGVVMLVSLFTTPTERPAYFGILGATFGLGTV